VKKAIRLMVWALALVMVAGAGWYTWYATRDYGAVFRRRAGRLQEAPRTLVSQSARTATYDVLLRSDRGWQMEARLRVPRRPGPHPAVLLTVGLQTGKRVVELIEDFDDLVVMALDYGWREPFAIASVPDFGRTLPRVWAASRDVVPGLLLAVELLMLEPPVDPDRVAVVGVSYGSYFALAAGALEPRVRQVFLLQGGAPIDETLAINAAFWQAPLPPRILGWLGNQLFLPFRPDRWVPRISPRAVTFVASRQDDMLPARGVERVFALAGEPRELLWVDLPHAHRDATTVIPELTKAVVPRLRGAGAAP
jgi:hypothetical protein